jgi:hypothetical protein
VGAEWASAGNVVPVKAQKLWSQLFAHRNADVAQKGAASLDWKRANMKLLAIADEASAGIGFFDPAQAGGGPIPGLVLSEYKLMMRNQQRILVQLPFSLCLRVPSEEVCVQPKTNTPAVGCTLRSLSHHLSLLPGRATVATEWHFAHPNERSEGPLNLLIVPLPYVIRGEAFSATVVKQAEHGYFNIAPTWLGRGKRKADWRRIAQLLVDLVRATRRETAQVHGVVIPEGAIPAEYARPISNYLAASIDGLELFIAGTISTRKRSNLLPKNCAFMARSHRKKLLHWQFQSKHHRWSLDAPQITRYHLGHVLNPDMAWWERINVEGRGCIFTVIRPGASLAVLVCEDLARVDPVLPAINAVGPNLVVALLMDGPQLEHRWPGRYATVLADDPGSSVLTVTSVGMVDRSSMPGEARDRRIALWKEQGGTAKAIQLPKGDHAVLLSLSASPTEQVSLDGRSDGRMSARFKLSGVRGIRLKRWPAWLELD